METVSAENSLELCFSFLSFLFLAAFPWRCWGTDSYIHTTFSSFFSPFLLPRKRDGGMSIGIYVPKKETAREGKVSTMASHEKTAKENETIEYFYPYLDTYPTG